MPAAYSSGGGFLLPDVNTPTMCVGLINEAFQDETGGMMAEVTPSIYILETIRKALGAK